MKLIVLLLGFSLNAWAGGMVGNGGDAVLQEFNLRGIQMANYFSTETLVAKSVGVDPVRFMKVVHETSLSGADHLTLNGVEVDAINYPSEQRIEVSRTRWIDSAQRLDSFFVQRRIALHEYLWIYGIDDTGYSVSNQIIEQFERSAGHDADPVVQDLLRGKVCDALTSNWDHSQVDFILAEKFLSWGLDVNGACQVKRGKDVESENPMGLVFATYFDGHNYSDPDKAARTNLIEKMLRYGADPNGWVSSNIIIGHEYDGSADLQPIGGYAVAIASKKDLELLKQLFRFGANPNFLIGDSMRPTWVFTSLRPGYSDPAPSLDVFQTFIDAGLDVNAMTPQTPQSNPFSVARAMVRYWNAEALVEALIKTGKVDWCHFDDATQTRTFDLVVDSYKPLLKKYSVSCPKIFGPVWGQAFRCEDETANALEQCKSKGFARVTEILKDGKSTCWIEGDQQQSWTIHSGTYYCEEE
jgi:hypothetical protein